MELDRSVDEGRHVETILTCVGDINDPQFPQQFKKILSSLRSLICLDSNERRALRVSKVEPWNSVRVTFSLGPDAAERLRSLAAEAGGEVLARLGILSVQLRPSEQVISIRVAAPGNNPHGNSSGAVGGASAVPAPHQPTAIHHSLHQQQHQSALQPQVGQLSGATTLASAPLHHQTTSVAQQLAIVDGVASRVLQAPQGLLTSQATTSIKPPPPSPSPSPAAVQVQASTPSNRSFPFPQQSPSHHLQLQQPKASATHYPPPPYPGGASSRPSVLSGGVNPESKIEPTEGVSPLLVNLLQNDGGSNIQHQAQTTTPIATQQQQPAVVPPSPTPQSHIGSRGFTSTGAPQTVVHHRPPTQSPNPTPQATSLSHHLSSVASRPHQPPAPSMLQVAQLQQQQQQQLNAAHHQQQVSVVQPPLSQPSLRVAPASTQPSRQENVRSPSPPPTQDLTSSGKARQYLINPLTGVLEPMSSESSEEEEVEAGEFPPSPVESKSDGEDSATINGSLSLGSSVGNSTLQHSSIQSVPHQSPQLSSVNSSIAPTELGSATSLGTSSMSAVTPPEEVRAAEKLKLRLKLDKSAPYNVCYTSLSSSSDRLSSSGVGEMRVGGSLGTDRSSSSSVSEPRVPPLHISLRGINVPRNRERKREGKVRKKSEPTLPLPPRPELTTALLSTSPPPQPLPDRTAHLSGASPLNSSGSVLSSPVTVSCSTNTGLSSSSSSIGTNSLITSIGTTSLIDRPQPPLQVSAYPTEAEVASILRSVPEVTTDEKKRKRSHPKSLTPLRPQLEDKRRKVVNSTAAHSTPSPGSLVKSLIKHLAKDHSRIDKVERDRDRDRERQEREREREREREQREQQKKVAEDSSSGSSPEGQTTPIVPFISNGRSKTTTSEYNCKSSPPSASVPPPSQASPQVTSAGYPAKPSPGDKAPGIDKAGEDSGIESMDALSEKSPNRGDSPNRKEETLKKEGTIIIGKVADGVEDVDEDSVEDPVPIRLTPALYTYSNPEKQREGSPPLEIVKSDYPASRSRSNSLSGGKSLLEQLLIDIPSDRERESLSRRSSTSSTTTTTANTATANTTAPNGRNHRLVNRSPEEILTESGAPTSPAKPRGRKASESSTTSHDDAPTTRSKRKCSENATELIKACMGGVAGSVPTDGIPAMTPSPSSVNPTVPPVTPIIVTGEEKKRKESLEEEIEVEKRTAPEELMRHRPKEDDKYKAGGRRSTRQEVKRSVHRKRQRPEETPSVAAPAEPKLRRRTAAKETAK